MNRAPMAGISLPMMVSKRIFAVVAILLLLPFAVGFFLSPQWEATGEAPLEIDPDRAFEWLTSARHWHVWNQSAEDHPVPFAVEYSGPEFGVGSKLHWSHEQLGRGELEVIEMDPGSRVRIQIIAGAGEPVLSEVQIERQPPRIRRRDWSTFSGLGPLDGYVAWVAKQAGDARIARSLETFETHVAAAKDPAPPTPDDPTADPAETTPK